MMLSGGRCFAVLAALAALSSLVSASIASRDASFGEYMTMSATACNAGGNCTSWLNQLLRAPSCKDGRGCTIALDYTTYKMEVEDKADGVVLLGLQNVRLLGASTVLEFQNRSHFFVVEGCTNIFFAGFSVDMARVPFTVGTLVAFDSRAGAPLNFTIHVDDTTLYPIDETTVASHPVLHHAQAVIGYDAATERFLVPDVYMTTTPCATTFDAAAGTMHVQCPAQRAPAPSQFTLGKTLVVRHQVYNYNAFTVQGTPSKQLVWRAITLYSAGGMGVYADFPSDVSAEGFRTLRKRYPDGRVRAMSITADGFHVCNALGGTLSVSNSVFEGQGDDGINFNTRFARVMNTTPAANGQTTLTLETKGAVPAGYFMVGSVPRFYDGRTMLEIFPPAPVSVSALTPWPGLQITVNTSLANTAAFPLQYALIVNGDAVASSVSITATTFRNNRARGVLLKQPRASIDGCTFEGMTSPAVLVQVDGCFWMEGLPVTDWAVRSSTFLNVDRWGSDVYIQIAAEVPTFDPHTGAPTTTCVFASTPGVLKNISVSDNLFITNVTNPDPPSQAIVDEVYAVGVDRLQIVNNTAVVANAPGRNAGFAIADSTNVQYEHNACRANGSPWFNCTRYN